MRLLANVKSFFCAALAIFYLRIRLLQAGLQATPVPLDVDIPYDTPLIELSGGNGNSATNLQACTGECNTDNDCAGSLKCFQRTYGEPIPGCKGYGSERESDYCYDPNLNKPGRQVPVRLPASIEPANSLRSPSRHEKPLCAPCMLHFGWIDS